MGIQVFRRSSVLVAVVLAVSGCSSTAAPTPTQRANLEGYTVPPLPSTGTFRPWTDGATAVTYDQSVVPSGSTATLTVVPGPHGVEVHLAAAGMVPGRSYGAHLHTGVCTAVPAAAGPHYQHIPDPAADAYHPSTDPAYANPGNEVWLDFTAGATGTAIATATESWTFDAMHPPRSLVIHAAMGMGGARAACLTLTHP
jgi:Cu-Zn family superoxide dismutase